jgi:hypothetical protein
MDGTATGLQGNILWKPEAGWFTSHEKPDRVEFLPLSPVFIVALQNVTRLLCVPINKASRLNLKMNEHVSGLADCIEAPVVRKRGPVSATAFNSPEICCTMFDIQKSRAIACSIITCSNVLRLFKGYV